MEVSTADLSSSLAQSSGSLQNLKQSGWYRLLVESVQDYAIFLLDTNGYIISWNAGAQRIKGYKSNEIIGKHFSTFYTKRDLKADLPAKLLNEARQKGSTSCEGWRLRKDGSRFWASVVITALFDNEGRLQGFAKVSRDLSAHKKHEDDLKKANQLLKKQRRELKKLNRAKDEFISLASHQLRTPATVVKQYLALALAGYGGKLSPKQQDFIEKAQRSNNRQIEVANDLLKVAQIDAGRVELKKRPHDLGKLIQTIVNDQRDSFINRGQKVVFNLPNTTYTATVDQNYFRMVIENLLSNASKYTPRGGTITLAVDQVDKGVVVYIKDTGVGIKDQFLPNLFKQFSRIPNSLSEEAGGSGLGLYWAQKVAKLHGGYIAVDSKDGVGSTFKVCLPRSAGS